MAENEVSTSCSFCPKRGRHRLVRTWADFRDSRLSARGFVCQGIERPLMGGKRNGNFSARRCGARYCDDPFAAIGGRSAFASVMRSDRKIPAGTATALPTSRTLGRSGCDCRMDRSPPSDLPKAGARGSDDHSHTFLKSARRETSRCLSLRHS